MAPDVKVDAFAMSGIPTAPLAGMTDRTDKIDTSDTTRNSGTRDGVARGVATSGAGGAPLILPDDGDTDSSTPAAATGPLATSGRDDVERRDTVSGLGSADVMRTNRRGKRKAVEPGPQSGAPTPGNRG
jgi:hypothetical protein